MNKPVPVTLTMKMIETFQAMNDAGIAVKVAITQNDQNQPTFIPTLSESNQEKTVRQKVADSMTRLFVDRDNTTMPINGLVCGSPETVKAVERFNKQKLAFKQVIAEIRYWPKPPNSQGAKPVRWERTGSRVRDEIVEALKSGGYRNEQLKKAMGNASIGALDLKRCYAQIRIMPSHLDAVNWTWAMRHSSIQRITFSEAMAMADALHDTQREVAIGLLNENCDGTELFARVVPLPPQLRINYVYQENGEAVRKASPVSGVVIAQQSTLPSVLWRDQPEPGKADEQLQRRSSIEREPFIKSLGLHRYVR